MAVLRVSEEILRITVATHQEVAHLIQENTRRKEMNYEKRFYEKSEVWIRS